MGRGFRGRERRERSGEDDAPFLDESGVRIDGRTVAVGSAEFPLDEIVAARQVLSKPMWGPLVLSVLGTFNLIVGFETGALRDFVAAAIMLGAGLLWRTRGTRHILIINVRGREEAPWATRDGELMGRVVATLEERIAAERGP